MSDVTNISEMPTVTLLTDTIENVQRNQELLREELHALVLDLVRARADLSSESLEATQNGWALDRCSMLLRHEEEARAPLSRKLVDIAQRRLDQADTA